MILKPEQVVELLGKEYKDTTEMDFKNLAETIIYLANKLKKN